MSESLNSGIMVVGHTYEPWAIPQTFLRRFTELCHIVRPSPEHAVSILRLKIRTIIKCHSLQDNDIGELGRQMVGFTGSDIDTAVSNAWFVVICVVGGALRQSRDTYSSDILISMAGYRSQKLRMCEEMREKGRG